MNEINIKELLFLSKNPHFTFSAEEQAALDDFFSKKREESRQNLPKKKSKKSSKSTPATANSKSTATDTVKVKNIVEKTTPEVEEIV